MTKEQTVVERDEQIEVMWEVIHKKYRKSLASVLCGGASEDCMEKMRVLGAPSEMLALYAAHNGSTAEFFGSYQLLSVEEIEEARSMMNGLLAEKPTWEAEGRWDTRWVPFLGDGDGQFYLFDPIGVLEGCGAGAILLYDHESGAERAFASFGVFVDLVTKLAKKGLLSQEEQEEKPQAYEDLFAAAQSVGLAKMPPKELKKVKEALNDPQLVPSEILKMSLPLARQYGATVELWSAVLHAAIALEDWALASDAAARTERLMPARSRPFAVKERVLALHRLGRNEDALAVLRAALPTATHYPENLVDKAMDMGFRRACFALATDVYPQNDLCWLYRAECSEDQEERQYALQKTEEVGRDVTRAAARRLLELERIETLTNKERLEALIALAKAYEEQHWSVLGGHHNDGWVRVAAYACEIGAWDLAEMAGQKVMGLLYRIPLKEHQLPGYRVLALYKLGREGEALALLESTIRSIYRLEATEITEALEAIPWAFARDLEDQAFAERCQALALAIQAE